MDNQLKNVIVAQVLSSIKQKENENTHDYLVRLIESANELSSLYDKEYKRINGNPIDYMNVFNKK